MWWTVKKFMKAKGQLVIQMRLSIALKQNKFTMPHAVTHICSLYEMDQNDPCMYQNIVIINFPAVVFIFILLWKMVDVSTTKLCCLPSENDGPIFCE